ncbi:MAG TPA: pentapeptide repeat-containing protein [Kofleriaceae bacterium]
MTSARGYGRDAAIEALLRAAQREILAVAVATCAMDEDAVAIASARLRWAIDSARPLILALGTGARRERHACRLDRIANGAQRWLAAEPPRTLHEIARLVGRVSARRGRQGWRGPAIVADHAALVDLDLDDLDLIRISLRGASLTEVTLRRTGCVAADARSSRWLRCQLEDGSLAMAVLAGARLERCDLSRASLDGTSWHRALLVHCVLRRASLIDARLDRADVRDCDLRGADLSIARSPEVATLAGTRFVRCDLRDTRWNGRELGGAVFVDCKLFGARGASALAGVVIERPDLSRLGDGSQIATQTDVVAGWPPA